ncbi:MAG: helix-turn-helix domain-containing protein [Actinobacteria bacterium]|nr:helix-turn-helix domain-containing protein [Actinomycetota bacterium]
MRLAALLRAVEESPGTVTVADLAKRLRESPETVRAMLAALRAAGHLGPEGSARPGTEECASAASCAVSCPGPGDCPFVVDLGVGLEVRRQ